MGSAPQQLTDDGRVVPRLDAAVTAKRIPTVDELAALLARHGRETRATCAAARAIVCDALRDPLEPSD